MSTVTLLPVTLLSTIAGPWIIDDCTVDGLTVVSCTCDYSNADRASCDGYSFDGCTEWLHVQLLLYRRSKGSLLVTRVND